MSRVYGINKGHHITKSLAKSGVLMSVMALSVSALATVGGGQRIEILGYDKAEQKVFVLRHYDDGRGRLPQLYYYDFTSKKPEKLVEVRSLYINPKTKKYDEFEGSNGRFSAGLKQIKNRVVSLKPSYTQVTVQVETLKQKKTNLSSWLGEIGQGTEYQFNYKLKADEAKLSSSSHSATTYSVCLTTDNVVYKVPNQPYALSTVKYKGTLMEGGYDYQDVVLLNQTK